MPVNSNVAPLSVNVAASILAQYVSFSVAPAGLGDPGPLQYSLSTHYLEHLNDTTSPHCATEAADLAQYVSFSVAPAGLGDPGPLQYSLSTHYLEHLNDTTSPHCATEAAEGAGDHRVCLTGLHESAERQRQLSGSVGASIRLLRWFDDRALEITRWLDRP